MSFIIIARHGTSRREKLEEQGARVMQQFGHTLRALAERRCLRILYSPAPHVAESVEHIKAGLGYALLSSATYHPTPSLEDVVGEKNDYTAAAQRVAEAAQGADALVVAVTHLSFRLHWPDVLAQTFGFAQKPPQGSTLDGYPLLCDLGNKTYRVVTGEPETPAYERVAWRSY